MDKSLHWDAGGATSDAALLALEAQYCSHGDTVHYTNPAKIFTGCEGSFMYDSAGREFLDLGCGSLGRRAQRRSDAKR